MNHHLASCSWAHSESTTDRRRLSLRRRLLVTNVLAALRHRHDLDDVAWCQHSIRNLSGTIDLVAVHHDDHARIDLQLIEKVMHRKSGAVFVPFAVDGH